MDQLLFDKHCDQIIQNYMNEAACTYMVDITDDLVTTDIISRKTANVTKLVELKTPCSYNELVKRILYGKYKNMECTLDEALSTLTCEELARAFEAGHRVIESTVYLRKEDLYYRAVHVMDRDAETGHIIACVLCHNINTSEKLIHRELADIESIISSAGMGIWQIYLFENEQPRMKANRKMQKLLGIQDANLSEEEVYEIWFSGIKKSSLPSVIASVEEMKQKGKSENTYIWMHPTAGEIYVRCGGISSYIEGKGYVLRGYHSDVTEIINSDVKHKQLLEDALEEVKHQKALLQQALDNYKQADYDRRRDYLTGLRNRQDMYEMLQDNLSGIRNEITAMFMMDVDNFKMLNDNYGHVRGDECLKKICNALMEYEKNSNIYFYRYGGEEILGISFGTTKPGAEIAEELVKLIYDLQIERDDLETKVVTISLGYTCDTSSYEKMIDKADAAMYHAKSNGKNQAVCYENM